MFAWKEPVGSSAAWNSEFYSRRLVGCAATPSSQTRVRLFKVFYLFSLFWTGVGGRGYQKGYLITHWSLQHMLSFRCGLLPLSVTPSCLALLTPSAVHGTLLLPNALAHNLFAFRCVCWGQDRGGLTTEDRALYKYIQKQQ